MWEAVKIAKDQNIDDLPDQMKHNGTFVSNENLAEEFATMFEKKIQDIVAETTIDNSVYNGVRKVTVEDKNFMTGFNIRNAILSLKLKNSEGYDRIPQRILLDGVSQLTEPFLKLFTLIYTTNTIPEQWSISNSYCKHA